MVHCKVESSLVSSYNLSSSLGAIRRTLRLDNDVDIFPVEDVWLLDSTWLVSLATWCALVFVIRE